MKRNSLYLFFIFTVSIFLVFCNSSDNQLPILGVKEFDTEINDSINHRVQEFAFVNQENKLITLDHLRDKVTIVNFFFTSCPSICPIMIDELKRFQQAVHGKYDIQILSHTVDPRRDSVGKLKWFIDKKEINTINWDFVTGSQQSLYESGVYNYYLASAEDALAEGGFLHSEKFVLIDKDLHIRGYYNGTEKEDVNRLIKELEILFDEYS